jgi:hypothetical protein
VALERVVVEVHGAMMGRGARSGKSIVVMRTIS